mgnify:CR=1 FL=1
MRNKFRAVSDAGPIIHLLEIDAAKVFTIITEVLIPEQVFNETKNLSVPNIKIVNLTEKHKDLAKILTSSYNLGFGEAEAISLCMQEGIKLFLTDDMDARTIGKHYNLEVHGTVGLLVESFRAGIFTEKEVIAKLELLRTKSTLFITKDLLDWSIKRIEEHSGKIKK